MTTLSLVTACATSACSFNDGGCTAIAINVGGSDTASCTTFTDLDARAGLASADSAVGACKRLECAHNTDMLCTAGQIAIGDAADCLSYTVN